MTLPASTSAQLAPPTRLPGLPSVHPAASELPPVRLPWAGSQHGRDRPTAEQGSRVVPPECPAASVSDTAEEGTLHGELNSSSPYVCVRPMCRSFGASRLNRDLAEILGAPAPSQGAGGKERRGDVLGGPPAPGADTGSGRTARSGSVQSGEWRSDVSQHGQQLTR